MAKVSLALEPLWTFLDPEPDEVAVISVVTRIANDIHHVVKGSVVLGPPELGQGNWAAWHHSQGATLVVGDEPSTASYTLAGPPDLQLFRAVVSQRDARAWLTSLVVEGSTGPIPNVLPRMVADLATPLAPLRVSPKLGDVAATFIATTVRPGTGFLFRGETIDVDAARMWNTGSAGYDNAPLQAGLFVEPGQVGGVLLMRMERRAWLVRTGAHGKDSFECCLGVDPDRIDISDLTISLEEWVDEGLAHAQAVHLDQLPGIDDFRRLPIVPLKLPTLGTRVRRQVRLYDRVGTLLDATSLFEVAEAVRVSIVDSEVPIWSFTIGEERAVPNVLDRADAVSRVQAQYLTQFSAGAARSVVQPGQDVVLLLQNRLAQARGWLHVVDRYFGKNPHDWDMFATARVPVQVLMSVGQPPPTTLSGLQVHRWYGGTPPFHGRSYLWDGGGLSVDSSPDGFGKTVVCIVSLSPAQSKLLDGAFPAWWAASTPIS